MKLEFEIEFRLATGARMAIPVADDYMRGLALAVGGTFAGPRIRGRIIPGSGGAFPLIHADGGGRFESQCLLETDDGATILMRTVGVRDSSAAIAQALLADEEVDPNRYYMRVTPRFEAPAGPHDWLNRSLFVSVGHRMPGETVLHCWRVV